MVKALYVPGTTTAGARGDAAEYREKSEEARYEYNLREMKRFYLDRQSRGIVRDFTAPEHLFPRSA